MLLIVSKPDPIQVYILTESFKQLDAVYYFDTDSDYFDILETCWQESKEEVGDRIQGLNEIFFSGSRSCGS